MASEYQKDPYNPKTEMNYNWHFDVNSQRWRGTPKLRAPIKPEIETRATPNGIEIRKVGTEKWIPASEIIKPQFK